MLALLLLVYSAQAAQAAPVVPAKPSPAKPATNAKIYRDFVAACTEAFDRSSGNGAQGVGQAICECTAKESKHEGATPAAVAGETARIKDDPKYQIQDRRLLNALHYCAVELLHDT